MEEVPDPVFAQAMVGPGVAIEPDLAPVSGAGSVVDVVSPIAGQVATLLPHAFAIEGSDGRSALIHLGIDTVELKGEGFTSLVSIGDHVAAGQRVMTWNPRVIAERGLPVITPIVALQADVTRVARLAALGDMAEAGQPLLRWS